MVAFTIINSYCFSSCSACFPPASVPSLHASLPAPVHDYLTAPVPPALLASPTLPPASFPALLANPSTHADALPVLPHDYFPHILFPQASVPAPPASFPDPVPAPPAAIFPATTAFLNISPLDILWRT